MNITKELARSWRESGIFEGDMVLIHSSIKSTYKNYLKRGIKVTPEITLESFLDAVGPNSTILFPLFNFDFCNGEAFDINNTPSHMGALTEVARKYPGVVRTGHPVYSFCVIGKKKNQFHGICNHSAYGSESPFALLQPKSPGAFSTRSQELEPSFLIQALFLLLLRRALEEKLVIQAIWAFQKNIL